MAGGMACLYVAPPDPPRQRDVEILILRQEVPDSQGRQARPGFRRADACRTAALLRPTS
jgi:hypothetical protein